MTGSHAEPAWFGAPQAPMLGWWELPAGETARGSVVLCSSIAQENAAVYRSLRLLGESLAAAGFAVLRFAYPGAADSADRPGDDAAAGWIDGIREAVQHARQVSSGPLAVVATRIGALLLGAAGPICADAVVYWDPVASGRRWLRAQEALQRVTSAQEPVEYGVDVPGLLLSHRTADHLRELTAAWPAESGPDLPRLLLTPREERTPREVAGLAEAGNVEVRPIDGQQVLVEAGTVQARVPVDTLQIITDWLSRVMPDRALPLQTGFADSAEFASGDIRVRETVGRYGERGIGCVVTEAVDRPWHATALLLSGADLRSGPGRQWTFFARRWAAFGIRSVRVDVGGGGDSERVDDQAQMTFYTDRAIADAVDVMRVFAEPGRPLGVFGLCEGAWTAMRAAEQAPCTHLYPLNQAVWGLDPLDVGPDRPEPAAEEPADQRLRGQIRERFPAAVALLDELNLTRGPMARLAALSRRGISVTVLIAGDELPGFEVLAGRGYARRLASTGWRARLLRRRGQLRVLVTPGVDHGLLAEASRRALDAAVDPVVRAELAG